MTRRACQVRGHRFRDTSGMMALPFVYCTRWWCSATAVAVWVAPSIARDLHNAIPPADRFPPVTIEADGTVTPLEPAS